MKIVLNLKLREEEVVFKSTRIDFYKKGNICSFYSFYDNIEHVEERRTTLPQEHYCNQTITAFLIAL